MKIYALNVPKDHLSLEVLGRFGEIVQTQVWPLPNELKSKSGAMVFACVKSTAELKRVCNACEERGDWCFAWLSEDILSTAANDVSPALVDFVIGNFSQHELMLRIIRLVRLERVETSNSLFSVPEEIAEDLTKKQLIILKALFEAGEEGLDKETITEKLWKKGSAQGSKASGFNVHVLHLRRRLERFGLMISYEKNEKVYRLRAAVRTIQTRRRLKDSVSLQLAH